MNMRTVIAGAALWHLAAVAQAASQCDALPASAPVFETRKTPGALIEAQCNASMVPGLPAAVRSGTAVPGGELRFADDAHAQCELFSNNKRTGRFKAATVCGIGWTRMQEGALWKCRGADRVETVQVGTTNPRQACEQALANAPTGTVATQGGAPGVATGRLPKPLPGADSGGAKPLPVSPPTGPAVAPPEVSRPDLTIVAVRDGGGTEVDVVVRNIGNAPNLNRCFLNSTTEVWDSGAPGPSKWRLAGCRGGQNVPIDLIAPGKERSYRICGYTQAEIDRDTGLSVWIQIDRGCDPQRDGNNLFAYRQPLSEEAARREYCGRHRDAPGCAR